MFHITYPNRLIERILHPMDRQTCLRSLLILLTFSNPASAGITVDSYLVTVDSTLVSIDSTTSATLSQPVYNGFQKTSSGNQGSFSVEFDQLGLVPGDVAIVSVTTDYAQPDSIIVHKASHPGGTTIYNATGQFGQPRMRVDVLVYDGSWPNTLDYTFSTPDNESWIAYVTRWSNTDSTNPVASSAGHYAGVTANPTTPEISTLENNLAALTIYGAREDDFDSNGTPSGYTPIDIAASNTGSTGCSSGIAYKEQAPSGVIPAATWTQAAETQAHAVLVLLTGLSINNDLDGDGLANDVEIAIGTDPANADTDGDSLDDLTEISYDGDPTSYSFGLDTDPLSPDPDQDGILDNEDPIPLDFNFADGDIAPLGAPDGSLNAADLLIAQRIALGSIIPTSLELAHGDLYPPGAPDGKINVQDLILIQQMLWQ